MTPILAMLAMLAIGPSPQTVAPATPPPVFPVAQPTADQLNLEIRAAIAAGRDSYTLPLPALALNKALVIPEGTRGFTLRGAPGGTKVTATGPIGYVVTAGPQTGWNQWPVSSYPTADVANVPDGATSVTLKAPFDLKAGDDVALWDAEWTTHTGGTDSQTEDMEPLTVVKVDGAVVTFDHPTHREYLLVPKLSKTTGHVLHDITIEGIDFDASYPGGRNNGVVAIGLVDGLKLKDLATRHFSSRTIQVNVGRNIELTRVNSYDGADLGNPGSGYGPTFMKCHGVEVKDCESDTTRHGFMATNGSTDVTYWYCRSLGPNGNFDTHGFDERRVRYLYCRMSGNLNIGNTAYLRGGSDFLVKGCEIGYAVLVSSNTRNVDVLDSHLWGVAFQSIGNDPKARPTGGRAEGIHFRRCRFDFLKNAFTETGDVSDLTFDQCVFTSGGDPYTQFMTLKWVTGTIAFTDCTIVMNGTGVYTPIVLSQNNADTFRLTLDRVTIVNKAAVWSAVQLAKGFRGQVVVRDSNVATSRGPALFIDNQGAVKAPQLAGAAVVRP